MRTIEENSLDANPFTVLNVNDLTFIHLYLKILTMINYKTDHPLVTHEDMSNLELHVPPHSHEIPTLLRDGVRENGEICDEHDVRVNFVTHRVIRHGNERIICGGDHGEERGDVHPRDPQFSCGQGGRIRLLGHGIHRQDTRYRRGMEEEVTDRSTCLWASENSSISPRRATIHCGSRNRSRRSHLSSFSMPATRSYPRSHETN